VNFVFQRVRGKTSLRLFENKGQRKSFSRGMFTEQSGLLKITQGGEDDENKGLEKK
jgi:hypothetical protein